ncbi:transcriptional regulator [Halobacteriales archaeon QS_8_69_26]|nr:MAG: transcriptional regulator [Halobacteriales archaeon QS_8_69_26]
MADPLDEAHLHEFDSEAVVPEVLAVFGKKHALAIVYEFVFAEEPLRFSDLEAALDISSTTLSNRLSELVDGRYVTRESYDEIPPRVEYEATEKTRALAPIFLDVYEWAKEYEADPDAFGEG